MASLLECDIKCGESDENTIDKIDQNAQSDIDGGPCHYKLTVDDFSAKPGKVSRWRITVEKLGMNFGNERNKPY